jgi:hypothetical protein
MTTLLNTAPSETATPLKQFAESCLIQSDLNRLEILVHEPAGFKDSFSLGFHQADGGKLSLNFIRSQESEGGARIQVFDASSLQLWSIQNPVLYKMRVSDDKGESVEVTFGYRHFSVDQGRICLNRKPLYVRAFICGIAGHDTPNSTGKSDLEFFRNRIRNAKKFGFNAVRFHSTIPSQEFYQAANELGFLVHLEIGFKRDGKNPDGTRRYVIDLDKWRDTISSRRNHPSAFTFCLGNEMHRSGRHPQIEEAYHLARRLAPNTLMVDNSGWGEFDRLYTDYMIQHAAYFFPVGAHADMFSNHQFWHINGSKHSINRTGSKVGIEWERSFLPEKPVLAHEINHSIHFPDYIKLNREFDAFIEWIEKLPAEKRREVINKVWSEGVIQKPKYLEPLVALINQKGLKPLLPRITAASRHFWNLCTKMVLEKLRQAENFQGYQMLQLVDSFKYENKNGLIDIFDRPKDIDPDWFRQSNDDVVILMNSPDYAYHAGQSMDLRFSLSIFGSLPVENGELTVTLVHETGGRRKQTTLFKEPHFTFSTSGLKPLAKVIASAPKTSNPRMEVRAVFTSGDLRVTNTWPIWSYPKATWKIRPTVRVNRNAKLRDFLKRIPARAAAKVIFTDVFDKQVLRDLKQGRTVLLNFNPKTHQKGALRKGEYYLNGVKDHFKPTLWDRGHQLGGFCEDASLSGKLGLEKGFLDIQLYPLIEGATKLNLDIFPRRIAANFYGIDKPVRDRMDALAKGQKEINPNTTMRRFAYLVALKVGRGTLVLTGFNLENPDHPAVQAFLSACVSPTWRVPKSNEFQTDEFLELVKRSTKDGPYEEGVMTLFWLGDDRPVEDQLFWEEMGIDLARLRH